MQFVFTLKLLKQLITTLGLMETGPRSHKVSYMCKYKDVFCIYCNFKVLSADAHLRHTVMKVGL